MMRNMKVGRSEDTRKPGDEIVLTANPSKSAGGGFIVNGEEMPSGNAAPGLPGLPKLDANRKRMLRFLHGLDLLVESLHEK